MRTRLIRPSFWTDSRMADLPDPVRLTYVGLWCLADDAGYFESNPREIAAELYRYRATRTRERQVVAHLGRLVSVGCIRSLECGRHAVIPSLPQHRIKGGQQLLAIQKDHDLACPTPKDVALRRTTERSVSVSVSDTVSVSGSLSDTGTGPTANGSSDPSNEFHRVGRSLRAAMQA